VRARLSEQAFAESLIGQGDDRQLAMQPSRLSEFITLVRERFEEAAREGEAPVLVTSSNIRPFVRGIVERFRAQRPVLSQGEIHPRARLKTSSLGIARDQSPPKARNGAESGRKTKKNSLNSQRFTDP
jgi:flagellar biosynthesis component FlhA